VFAGNQIPDVGTVIMAWYNNPVSIKAPPPQETGGDTHMSEANSPPPQNIKMEEDSYDLAEDDEGRWLPE
jgi:RNA-binding protein 26